MTFLQLTNSTLLHAEELRMATIRVQLEAARHHGAKTYQLQAERKFHLPRTKRIHRYLLPMFQQPHVKRILVIFTRDVVFLPKLGGRTQEAWAQDTTAVMVCMWTKIQNLMIAARSSTAQFLSHSGTTSGGASRVVSSFGRPGQLNVVAIYLPMCKAARCWFNIACATLAALRL